MLKIISTDKPGAFNLPAKEMQPVVVHEPPPKPRPIEIKTVRTLTEHPAQTPVQLAPVRETSTVTKTAAETAAEQQKAHEAITGHANVQLPATGTATGKVVEPTEPATAAESTASPAKPVEEEGGTLPEAEERKAATEAAEHSSQPAPEHAASEPTTSEPIVSEPSRVPASTVESATSPADTSADDLNAAELSKDTARDEADAKKD
jgi:hypothetical protein